MSDTIKFELVSPEGIIFSKEVEMVVLPGSVGDFSVLKDHALFVSSLRSGVIEVFEDKEVISDRVFVADGFAEIKENICTALVSESILISNIDVEECKQKIQDAENSLTESDENKKVEINKKIVLYKAMIDAKNS